eukprot:3877688-Pyramimonas_sp.AAC.1
MRSAIGNKFYRMRNEDSEYGRKLKAGWEAASNKTAFKTQWVNETWSKEIKEFRRTIQEHSQDWREKGRLVSFMKMLYLEGGPEGQKDPQTIADCRVTALQCVQLGYPYVQSDPANGSTKFLHFELQYQEKFKEMWQQVSEQTREQAMENGGNAAPGGPPAPAPKPRAKPKPAGPEVASLNYAKKFTTTAQLSITAAEKLLEKIKKADDQSPYAWMNNQGVLDMIEKPLLKVDRAIKKNALAEMLLAQTPLPQ